MLHRHAVFIDLETTGADPGSDRITEIGLVEVRDGATVAEWSSLVNPEVPIPPFIARMTGITDAMVAAAPRFHEVAGELIERLRGRLFIAHNARFDYGFVRSELHRLGAELQEDMLCTVRLSRKLWPEHRAHGLDAVMARHGIVCEQRHRALGDAKALVAFMHAIYRHHPRDRVEQALAVLVKRPGGAPGIPARVLDAVPQGQGVYRLYDDGGRLLYVGKSARLRSAVRGHFDTEGGERDAALARAARHVEWIETAGELGAVLREQRMLRLETPMHNRPPGPAREPYSWRISSDRDGLQAGLVQGAAIDVTCLESHFGLFRSRRAAELALREIAAKRGLCLRRLGLGDAGVPCTAAPPSECRGACVVAEAGRRHDARLVAALAPLRLRGWPYRGRIGIRERGAGAVHTEVHVVDHWHYLGSATDDAALAALLETRSLPVFEAESYRLFTRLLERRKGAVEVVDLDGRVTSSDPSRPGS